MIHNRPIKRPSGTVEPGHPTEIRRAWLAIAAYWADRAVFLLALAFIVLWAVGIAPPNGMYIATPLVVLLGLLLALVK